MNMIKTQIVTLSGDELQDLQTLKAAGEMIRRGGLVAFPTETVYGIGANALDEEAVKKIYIAKGRPSDNPLIMHISQKEVLADYVLEVSATAKLLIDSFWPGPLTMVFRKSKRVPDCITGGLDTVAIRMPSHTIARGIIDYAGVPVAAPSANLSGKPSPTRSKHVIDDLTGRVDMIIEGGKATLGLESTVLDVTGEIPCILRPGSITKSMIEEVVGSVTYDKNLQDQEAIPKSPGMKYKHYAPSGNLIIIKSKSDEDVIAYINEKGRILEDKGEKVGVIVPSHVSSRILVGVVMDIGNHTNSTEIGSNLFKILRKMDELQVKQIFSFEFKGDELMLSIMNRLHKAAGHQIVNLDGDK